MIQFLIPHINKLIEVGYSVDVACSNVGNRLKEVKKLLSKLVTVYTVELYRFPLKLKNFIGCKQLQTIIANGNYDLVWTNEPVMGVMTRVAASRERKNGTKVMYMAHGFHFFKGAPILNWLIYYPVERIMAHHTDVIVTMNKEDYEILDYFNVRRKEYIHGIGVDCNFFKKNDSRGTVRQEFNIQANETFLVNVGELSNRKNQRDIILAISHMKCKNKIKLIICGIGPLKKQLKSLVSSLNLNEQIIFAGYRRDIRDILNEADIFVFPSKQEGLSHAIMESMGVGLPVVCSNIRGNVDLIDGQGGFVVDNGDIDGYASKLDFLVEHKAKREEMGYYNSRKIFNYDLTKAQDEILKIIESEIEGEV